jgi:hypothetical protein
MEPVRVAFFINHNVRAMASQRFPDARNGKGLNKGCLKAIPSPSEK